MKNVTLSLLAAAAIGAISIGSVSAMPVNNLAGLGENHFQDVRLVCDRFGRCYNTRRWRACACTDENGSNDGDPAGIACVSD